MSKVIQFPSCPDKTDRLFWSRITEGMEVWLTSDGEPYIDSEELNKRLRQEWEREEQEKMEKLAGVSLMTTTVASRILGVSSRVLATEALERFGATRYRYKGQTLWRSKDILNLNDEVRAKFDGLDMPERVRAYLTSTQ